MQGKVFIRFLVTSLLFVMVLAGQAVKSSSTKNKILCSLCSMTAKRKERVTTEKVHGEAIKRSRAAKDIQNPEHPQVPADTLKILQ